jgi:hypothetical protein
MADIPMTASRRLMKITTLSILGLIFTFASFLTACGNGQTSATPSSVSPLITSHGLTFIPTVITGTYVHFNDVNEAQKAAPFTIVVPRYFPNADEMKLQDIRAACFPFNATAVFSRLEVTYQSVNTWMWIMFNQSFVNYAGLPGATPFKYGDTEVTEISNSDMIEYHWFTPEWAVDVHIKGYSQEDARKIIPSMIL